MTVVVVYLILVTKRFADDDIELEEKNRGTRNAYPICLLFLFLRFSFLIQSPQAHGGFRGYLL